MKKTKATTSFVWFRTYYHILAIPFSVADGTYVTKLIKKENIIICVYIVQLLMIKRRFFTVRCSPGSERTSEEAAAPSSHQRPPSAAASELQTALNRSRSSSPHWRHLRTEPTGEEPESVAAAAADVSDSSAANALSPRDSSSSNHRDSNSSHEEQGGAGNHSDAEEEEYDDIHRLHRSRRHHHGRHTGTLQLGLEAGPGEEQRGTGLVGVGGPMGLPPPPQHITSM
jgi:hypothetical protein